MKFKYKDREYETNKKIKFYGGLISTEVIGTIKFGEYRDENELYSHLGVYVEFEWWQEDKRWSLPHLISEFGNREIKYPYVD